jgi:hypothetical protein
VKPSLRPLVIADDRATPAGGQQDLAPARGQRICDRPPRRSDSGKSGQIRSRAFARAARITGHGGSAGCVKNYRQYRALPISLDIDSAPGFRSSHSRGCGGSPPQPGPVPP